MALARTRWSLTDGQAEQILAIGVTVKPDGEILEPAAVGDAWEPAEDEGGAR